MLGTEGVSPNSISAGETRITSLSIVEENPWKLSFPGTAKRLKDVVDIFDPVLYELEQGTAVSIRSTKDVHRWEINVSQGRCRPVQEI